MNRGQWPRGDRQHRNDSSHQFGCPRRGSSCRLQRLRSFRARKAGSGQTIERSLLCLEFAVKSLLVATKTMEIAASSKVAISYLVSRSNGLGVRKIEPRSRDHDLRQTVLSAGTIGAASLLVNDSISSPADGLALYTGFVLSDWRGLGYENMSRKCACNQ